MADPRIIDHPVQIERITYSELRELSYMGANVLHEDAIYPVKDANIPIVIRNTNQPGQSRHADCRSRRSGSGGSSRFVTGIAGKKDFTVITMYRHNASNEVGLLKRALEVLEKYKISVEHVPSGIDNFSIVVSTAAIADSLYEIAAQLKQVCECDDIKVVNNLSLIAVVRPQCGAAVRHLRPAVPDTGRASDQHPDDRPGIRMKSTSSSGWRMKTSAGRFRSYTRRSRRKQGGCRHEKLSNRHFRRYRSGRRTMLQVLEEQTDWPVGPVKLLASPRSAGQTLMFKGQPLTLEAVSEDSFADVDVVLGAVENELAKRWAPVIVNAGAVFVDNSSAFRLDPDVPLVIPQINPQDIRTHQGIIANPNCATIIALMAVAPIYRLSRITRMIVSTYQAVSGAGAAGLAELKRQIAQLEAGQPASAETFPGSDRVQSDSTDRRL